LISFVIIGKNEGWKLRKCFQSIVDTINHNKITQYEIIYVDSNSSDDSIECAIDFKIIKIYKLTGETNAALGRNLGARESNGEVLFFIDGDMEILPEFFSEVYNEEKGLIYAFISGNYENHFYDFNGNFKNVELQYKDLTKDKFENVTGGLFLITKTLWVSVKGMKNSFKISEDIDLGLRIRRKGIPLLRKKEVAAKHHTISYLDPKRKWKDLINGNTLYAKSLLYREHILNKYIFSRIVRDDYSVIVLSFSLLMSLVFKSSLILIPYLLIILLKAIKISSKDLLKIAPLFFYYILRDIFTVIGFFIFFPKKNNQFKYEKL
jgi:glycosyltransferase involved in cell wall biosynthesis